MIKTAHTDPEINILKTPAPGISIPEETLIQNLIDAGCDRETVHGFLNCLREGDMKEGLCLLGRHRSCLMNRLHACQRKIDCLDYLLYRIRKNQ